MLVGIAFAILTRFAEIGAEGAVDLGVHVDVFLPSDRVERFRGRTDIFYNLSAAVLGGG
jgi:hypothetical protein